MRQKNSDGTVVDLALPDHGMVGVNLLAALEHAGVTAKWNRRTAKDKEIPWTPLQSTG